ncbi:MAG: molybdenum cofactor biosynthesis protein MoaE [Candidatus Ranarchaeia archaeon]
MTRKDFGKTGIHAGKENWATLDDMRDVLWKQPGIEKVGGVFTFSANVKDTTMEGKKQTALSVDVENKDYAASRLKEIVKDTEKHPLVHGASIHMNEGLLHPRDDILHLMITGVQDAPQVREVFDLLLEMLNRLKRETKTRFKEYTTDGAAYYKPKDPTKTFD